MNFIKK